MASFTRFGNQLYSGERSINIVGRRKIWYSISIVLVLVSIIGPILKGGFNFGIEFTGGSEFVVSQVSDLSQDKATQAVQSVEPGMVPKVSTLGDVAIRVQTEQLTALQTREIRVALADSYAVPVDNVTSSFIGASWGADITTQAIRGLLVFIVLAALVMALYFRTWKMSMVAIIALLHDLIITAGIYGITGFEVTPGAVIGLLTILGYSLYDTVVVFDKIRENTQGTTKEAGMTFASQVNLAVNQTLVRSINTSVVAALPVAAILFIGAFVLGAGTLRDISLALLIGIFIGTYSTIFLATPLYVQLRENEPSIKKADKKVLAAQAKTEGAAESVTA
ncbi:preprotein translocase subunit SecF [Aurantimicrobium minutum]|uniref:protein translocase subunit SecF n=1 Tax=Aurantimicrobium minutum TaxID=708131 RepID=UPI002473509B|nr:protein translocase subunit SecF [Aurantimicrobium minutum]MDH6533010.1 preprotein translocase subunit SecF [Aurantimicrobium minutum]